MARALRRELGNLVSWPEPKGGFFLWAAFPEGVNTDALLTRALARAVVYVAGSAFFIDGRSGNFARLAFSAASAPRIEEGIRRLAAAVSVIIAESGPCGMRKTLQASPCR